MLGYHYADLVSMDIASIINNFPRTLRFQTQDVSAKSYKKGKLFRIVLFSVSLYVIIIFEGSTFVLEF